MTKEEFDKAKVGDIVIHCAFFSNINYNYHNFGHCGLIISRDASSLRIKFNDGFHGNCTVNSILDSFLAP
jgi:hypothetical protein